MKYNKIRDLNISIICLGTIPFGTEITKEDSFALMDKYYELGGNFIDTALIYAEWIPGGKGMSEKTIGAWMKSNQIRKNILLGTKGGHPSFDNLNISRITPDCLREDLTESLGRLQTDYIDIYWLHRDDPTKPVEEILEVLNEFVREGKIRHFGCSNWKSSRIHQANTYAKKKNIEGFIANQIGWSLANPNLDALPDKTLVNMDDTELEFHQGNKFPAVAYSSQAKGFFSGIYKKTAKLPNTCSASIVEKFYYNETNFKRLEKVKQLARSKGKRMNQIALAYLINHDFMVFPIVGCRKKEHIEEACSAVDIKLSSYELNYLGGG